MNDTDAKTETVDDVMDPARAAAMQATLGLSGPTLTAGDVLPPLWHLLYFWTAMPPDRLGHDGHPATGQGLIPDFGLPHRMWASGDVTFCAPLVLGQPARRTTRLQDVTEKTGRNGPLAFVRLLHEIEQDGRLCLRETQELVYRGPFASARPAPRKAVGVAEHEEAVHFDSVSLFRYSALTFNGHRIHYDLNHATGPEGYDGLVVHGPLLASLLANLGLRRAGSLARFQFRAVAPLMHFEPAKLCMAGPDLWVEAPDRRLCMTATIS